ncbi:hypothetical protein GOARA_023_00020 [Gordonia araii NBRC 100433]|uniref:Uncharacterized protein n=1 Tax=Gordonia araii NBRC 100433 TaxID=1073574 RepID=G7GZC5_9ACTN|nr:hypothetical protein [Gordonia araii]NNG99068.1 hypothetical protein [Gordonia araii NBRC 100433]GAB08950.1 hypothetical protein GOARA_023_00020 [Gordonia araii NBRC 100433]
MTITREELHALVDRVPAQDLDRAASALSTLTDRGSARPHPRSLGAIDGEPDDSTQVDELLAEGLGR